VPHRSCRVTLFMYLNGTYSIVIVHDSSGSAPRVRLWIGIPHILAGIVLTLRLPHAWAQTQDERSPLDYDPSAPLLTFQDEIPGFRAGSFRWYPSATLSAGYDSNVLASQRDRSEDAMSVAQGLIRIDNESDVWGISGLGFVRARRFLDTARADTNEYGAAAKLDANLSSRDELLAEFAGQRRFEARTEIETPDFPLVSYYNEYRGNIAEQHTFNQLTTRLTVGARRLEYADSTQEFRNRWSYSGELRAAYLFHSGWSWLGTGYFGRDDYTRPSPLIDSASTTGGLAGIHFESPELLELEISGGPFKRKYAGGRGDLTGISVRAILAWQPTRLMIVRAQVIREDQATRVAGVLGKVRTTAGLQVDHSYSPNVSLYLRARTIFDDYDVIKRTDITYTAEAGMDVLLTRNYVFTLSYDYASRSSHIFNDSFQRHVASLSLTRRF
jgi:hypothetical protein